MQTELEFHVETKAKQGKGAARKARAAGKTPGVVYGYKMDPVMITFQEKELVKALSTPAARNVFLNLRGEVGELSGARVMVKELQVDPLRRVFLHADFYRLDPTRKIHANVPIRLHGTAQGVKLGGIMQVARRDLAVVCLPGDLPEAIEVDVTALMPGDSIHVGDLEAPKGVTILAPARLAVCVVIAPSGLQEDEAEEGEGEDADAKEPAATE
ncbi:MAG: 50S ribosomal protein L25 [Deferrisomatales bacterium]|nr:50S ribosomal protein L25 [Deferrisomatales bacterium]